MCITKVGTNSFVCTFTSSIDRRKTESKTLVVARNSQFASRVKITALSNTRGGGLKEIGKVARRKTVANIGTVETFRKRAAFGVVSTIDTEWANHTLGLTCETSFAVRGIAVRKIRIGAAGILK